MMKKGYMLGCLLIPAILIGCSVTPSSNTYTTNQAGMLQEVQMGKVLSVRRITIQENSADTGKVTGGVIGGVTGNDIGQGTGQIVGTVASAVIGGTMGMVLDRDLQSKQGVELIIELEGGKKVAIAQLADETFLIGDTVKVITTKEGKARVTH